MCAEAVLLFVSGAPKAYHMSLVHFIFVWLFHFEVRRPWLAGFSRSRSYGFSRDYTVFLLFPVVLLPYCYFLLNITTSVFEYVCPSFHPTSPFFGYQLYSCLFILFFRGYLTRRPPPLSMSIPPHSLCTQPASPPYQFSVYSGPHRAGWICRLPQSLPPSFTRCLRHG